jgi:DNA-binding transcriptional ArsR family regulator
MAIVRNPTFKTTLMVRDACLCLHAQRAARALARRFDDALRPIGLTNGQFSLMMSVNRPEPPDMGAVASLLGMDRTTLTAALKPLERRGLLRITVAPNDGRSRVINRRFRNRIRSRHIFFLHFGNNFYSFCSSLLRFLPFPRFLV